jgi:hypothetical protein
VFEFIDWLVIQICDMIGIEKHFTYYSKIFASGISQSAVGYFFKDFDIIF